MSQNPTPHIAQPTQSESATVPKKGALAISLWFDMQPDADTTQPVPLWARELAQAQADGDIIVLAHPDSAYAKLRLLCEVVKLSAWPSEEWAQHIARTVAGAQPTQQIAVTLPYRASPVVWAQWALLELGRCGVGLDNITGLLQATPDWQQSLHRPDAKRWLMIDRVITYGVGANSSDFLQEMRAFNPMARWIHEGFNDKNVLLQSINAYHKNMPMARIPLKNEDLSAWGANKVVYFATSNEMDAVKLQNLFEDWRSRYSQNIARLWAVVRLKGETAPLAVTSIYHLWSSMSAAGFSLADFPENRFWMLGEGLDAAQMQNEFEQCVA